MEIPTRWATAALLLSLAGSGNTGESAANEPAALDGYWTMVCEDVGHDLDAGFRFNFVSRDESQPSLYVFQTPEVGHALRGTVWTLENPGAGVLVVETAQDFDAMFPCISGGEESAAPGGGSAEREAASSFIYPYFSITKEVKLSNGEYHTLSMQEVYVRETKALKIVVFVVPGTGHGPQPEHGGVAHGVHD